MCDEIMTVLNIYTCMSRVAIIVLHIRPLHHYISNCLIHTCSMA